MLLYIKSIKTNVINIKKIKKVFKYNLNIISQTLIFKFWF